MPLYLIVGPGEDNITVAKELVLNHEVFQIAPLPIVCNLQCLVLGACSEGNGHGCSLLFNVSLIVSIIQWNAR